MYSDLSNIAPEHYTKSITSRLTDIQAVSSPDDRGVFIQVLESAYRFSLGSFAGGKTTFDKDTESVIKRLAQNEAFWVTNIFSSKVIFRCIDQIYLILNPISISISFQPLVPQQFTQLTW